MVVLGGLTNSWEEKWKAKEKGKDYTHLNAGFHRIEWRSKKPSLSEQDKGIEENDRKGKTRDLLRKIRDTKGTFHAKMGTKKGQKQ